MKEAEQQETTAQEEPIEPIIRETPEALKEDEELETMTGDPPAEAITSGAEASGLFGPTHGGTARAEAGYYGAISKSEMAVIGWNDKAKVGYQWVVLGVNPTPVGLKVLYYNKKGKAVWYEIRNAGIGGKVIVPWGNTMAYPSLRAKSGKLWAQSVKWRH